MNKHQIEYLLKNYKTQTEKELARNLQIDRKDLRRELRRILAAQKKDSGEINIGQNPQLELSTMPAESKKDGVKGNSCESRPSERFSFIPDLEEWLAGKEIYILLSLICLIGFFVFKDFFLLKKIYFYKDIGSDSVNLNYPYLMHVSHYVKSDGLLRWSFNQGLGQCLFGSLPSGTFFGLLLLLPPSLILEGVFFVEFIKIVLAGSFFFLYLRMLSLSRFSSVLGSIMFAYSGYMILGSCWQGFSMEVMLAAFFLYAFERYFIQKSWFLFPIAIALLSICQPFLLYLYSVFLLIYVPFRFFDSTTSPHPRLLPLFLKLAGLGLLGMAMGAFFMFSNVLQLLQSPRVAGTASYSNLLSSRPLFYFAPYLANVTAILRFFSNDMLGTGSNFKGWYNYLEAPLFYCGLPCLLLLPQIFISLNAKRKAIYSFVLLLWVLPIIFPWFRHLFWGFTGDYYRSFSFFVAIFMLFFSLHALHFIEKTTRVNLMVLVVTLGALLFVLFFPYFKLDSPVNEKLNVWAAGFLIAYARIIYSMGRANTQRLAQLIFIGLLAIELIVFSSITVNNRPVVTRDELRQKVGYNDYSVDAVASLNSIDKGFFRMAKYYSSGPSVHSSINDGLAQGYKGISSYYPFNQIYFIKFLHEIGVINAKEEWTTRWARGLEDRPLLHAVLNVKYALAKDINEKSLKGGYHLINQFGDVNVLQNDFNLPFGFTYDAFMPLEEFRKLSKEQKDIALLQACVLDKKDEGVFGELRRIEAGDIKTSLTPLEHRASIDHLGTEAFSMVRQNQNHIQGTITVSKKKVLFFSIPYDKGWIIHVDGKKVKPYLVNIGFIGIPLEPGKHTIHLHYRPPLLIPGAFVSLLGILVYLGLFFEKGSKVRTLIQ